MQPGRRGKAEDHGEERAGAEREPADKRQHGGARGRFRGRGRTGGQRRGALRRGAHGHRALPGLSGRRRRRGKPLRAEGRHGCRVRRLPRGRRGGAGVAHVLLERHRAGKGRARPPVRAHGGRHARRRGGRCRGGSGRGGGGRQGLRAAHARRGGHGAQLRPRRLLLRDALRAAWAGATWGACWLAACTAQATSPATPPSTRPASWVPDCGRSCESGADLRWSPWTPACGKASEGASIQRAVSTGDRNRPSFFG